MRTGSLVREYAYSRPRRLALFLSLSISSPWALIYQLGAARARAIDDLDAVLAKRGEPAIDLVGRDHVLGM